MTAASVASAWAAEMSQRGSALRKARNRIIAQEIRILEAFSSHAMACCKRVGVVLIESCQATVREDPAKHGGPDGG